MVGCHNAVGVQEISTHQASLGALGTVCRRAAAAARPV
jgi:hypothetical protein